MNKIKAFFQERIPFDWSTLEHPLREPVPYHMRYWWFALGGTPLILFFIQAATGILLTFYYMPSPPEAYYSVKYIQEVVPYGWWIRGIHHWGANLMIATVILHMMRVFFTGAYRRPRELNWLIGTGLLFTTLAFGFTGYSLIYNQLSYWATTVGTNLLRDLPVIGPLMLAFLRGGMEVTANTLTRFYSIHIGMLPTMIIVLVALHIFLFRLHGISQLDPKDKRTIRFFPDHVLLELVIAFYLVLILTSLAILFPPPLGELADPTTTPEHIKPEWYFYPIYRWLRLVPGLVGLIGVVLFVVVLVFWPAVDALLRRWFPKRDLSVVLGAITAIVLMAALTWEAMVP